MFSKQITQVPVLNEDGRSLLGLSEMVLNTIEDEAGIVVAKVLVKETWVCILLKNRLWQREPINKMSLWQLSQIMGCRGGLELGIQEHEFQTLRQGGVVKGSCEHLGLVLYLVHHDTEGALEDALESIAGRMVFVCESYINNSGKKRPSKSKGKNPR